MIVKIPGRLEDKHYPEPAAKKYYTSKYTENTKSAFHCFFFFASMFFSLFLIKFTFYF